MQAATKSIFVAVMRKMNKERHQENLTDFHLTNNAMIVSSPSGSVGIAGFGLPAILGEGADPASLARFSWFTFTPEVTEAVLCDDCDM